MKRIPWGSEITDKDQKYLTYFVGSTLEELANEKDQSLFLESFMVEDFEIMIPHVSLVFATLQNIIDKWDVLDNPSKLNPYLKPGRYLVITENISRTALYSCDYVEVDDTGKSTHAYPRYPFILDKSRIIAPLDRLADLLEHNLQLPIQWVDYKRTTQ